MKDILLGVLIFFIGFVTGATRERVLNGNKKLVLPQIFYWVLQSGEIKIIKLAPFTQSPQDLDSQSIEPAIKKTRAVTKTATKIIMEYSENLVLNEMNSDTVFLRIENLLNEGFELVKDYPGPGRNIILGARVKF